ncbi:MAG: asparagine synthase C-terminal domain-containing protein, partial [Phycisphaerales bacterium]|nr:asparagine synthase C-terminal domain-containing protein [Phycisphaerales bacterium]
DEPFADSSLLATTLLAKRVRDEIVVALGGDGGDELFGGYRRHLAAYQGHGMAAGLAAKFAWLPRPLSGRLRVGRLALAEAIARTRLIRKEAIDYPGLRRTQGDADWLLGRPSNIQEASDWLRRLSHASPPWDGRPVERLGTREAMLADLRTYLPDDPLVKLDRGSMAMALEARSPMLDHEVVEYALGMPTETLFDSKGGRAPIRQILRGMGMPDSSTKKGFAVPLYQWLRGPLKEWASDLIAQGDDDLLDQAAVQGTWSELQRGRRDRATTIWTVLCWRSWVAGRLR